jgi:hypothetical protein
MNQIHVMITLLAVSSFSVHAQRLDGCPAVWTPLSGVTAPPGEAVDRGLRDSGVGLTRDRLTAALGDPRADVRSLAALKFVGTAKRADLAPLMQAWVGENDPCTKGIMEMVLSVSVGELSYDTSQHPGGQPWITPFQACAASEPPTVTLAVEQATVLGSASPTVRISARNQTQQTVPFVGARSPQQLFSVTVLGPDGAPAKIAKGQEWMYEPVRSVAGLSGHGPTWVPLPPLEDVSIWTWRIGDDFDMSAPGTYRVSLGGRVGYLGTTVCSNTALVTVGK